MRVGDNTNTMKSLNALDVQEREMKKKLEMIATGKQIAALDPSGNMIAELISSEANTLTQGVKNANDAIAYMQVADGALKGVSDGALRLNELSVAYNNAALGQDSKNAILAEAAKLKEGMGQMVDSASFGGKSVFGDASFFAGSGNISASINRPNIKNADITNQDSILELQKEVNSTRANIGSTINQAYSSIEVNLNTAVNQRAAASGISDTDMAASVTDFNAAYLKSNASLFAVSHSNQYLSNQVSSLLG